jgi:hypothetical protein
VPEGGCPRRTSCGSLNPASARTILGFNAPFDPSLPHPRGVSRGSRDRLGTASTVSRAPFPP